MPSCARLAVVVALFAAAPWGQAAAQTPADPVLVELVSPVPVPVDVVSGVDVNNVVEVTAPDGLEVTAPDGIDVAVTNVVVPVQDEWQRPYQVSRALLLPAATGNGSIQFPILSGFYLVVTHIWVQVRLPNAQIAIIGVSGSFSGSDFLHPMGLSMISDTSSLTNTFAAAQPLTVYSEEDLTLLVTRGGGITGEVLTNATVTGYLLPVGGTNPR